MISRVKCDVSQSASIAGKAFAELAASILNRGPMTRTVSFSVHLNGLDIAVEARVSTAEGVVIAEADLPPRMRKILTCLKDQPRPRKAVWIAQRVRKTHVADGGLRESLAYLVRHGFLLKGEDGCGYLLPAGARSPMIERDR